MLLERPIAKSSLKRLKRSSRSGWPNYVADTGGLEQSSDHYKKFLEKFVAQETAIERLQQQARQAQAKVAEVQREHEGYMANLTVE